MDPLLFRAPGFWACQVLFWTFAFGAPAAQVPGPGKSKGAVKAPTPLVMPTAAQKQGALRRALAWEGQKANSFSAGGAVFTGDCSGFVRACYQSAGYTLLPGGQPKTAGGGCALLVSRFKSWGHLERARLPAPGDLLFFDNTWDQNGNGRADDRLTHVALVLSVSGKQVTALHMAGGMVKRLHLNMEHPDVFMSGKTVFNDYLRQSAAGQKSPSAYLASKLFSQTVGM